MTAKPETVDGRQETSRFARLDFDRFKDLAISASLSEHEKIGFPDGLREGFDEAIWTDIVAKLPSLIGRGMRILDIGPGCGPIARRMISLAEAQEHRAVFVDHAEMLSQLPSSPAVTNIAGRFPDDIDLVRTAMDRKFDVILTYSVLHCVVVDANPFAFIDCALSLLAPGGRLLVGDVPNVSKLRRFLASEAGHKFHRAYMKTEEPPDLPAFSTAEEKIDDAVVFGILMRARLAGFDSYVVPQGPELPLANRREDLLFFRS